MRNSPFDGGRLLILVIFGVAAAAAAIAIASGVSTIPDRWYVGHECVPAQYDRFCRRRAEQIDSVMAITYKGAVAAFVMSLVGVLYILRSRHSQDTDA